MYDKGTGLLVMMPFNLTLSSLFFDIALIAIVIGKKGQMSKCCNLYHCCDDHEPYINYCHSMLFMVIKKSAFCHKIFFVITF